MPLDELTENSLTVLPSKSEIIKLDDLLFVLEKSTVI